MKRILLLAVLFYGTGAFAQTGATTEIMTFSKGENLGSCRVVFNRENGEEVVFWNADLGQYVNPANPCELGNTFADFMFNITHETGSVQIVDQQGIVSTVETEVILDIQMIQ